MSLVQQPVEANWPILLDALKVAEGAAARDILAALAVVPPPREPGPYRDAILSGLRLGDDGAEDAVRLLAHWGGKPSPGGAGGDWKAELAQWQKWYAAKFPEAPPAELPVDEGRDKWSYDELLTFLASDAGKLGDPARGQAVFAKAQCAACHRVGSYGETLGPDLTTVGQRFQRKEILESIVYPSHIISDQYASRVIVANGKSYAGLVTPRGQGVTVLLSTGQKVEIAHEEIDDVRHSRTSAMPTGLLNPLTLEQVADLFAYLGSGGRAAVAARPAPAVGAAK
jgi:putative heme-binding domain-containing protein